MNKPSNVILNYDASRKSGRDEIETLDDSNDELNNDNIAFMDSVLEEESYIKNDFDKMQMDALEDDDVEVLRHLFTGRMTQSLSSFFSHSKLDFLPAKINDT